MILAALEPFARKTLADYLASPIDEVAVERYLERIIGRMIDINRKVHEALQAALRDIPVYLGRVNDYLVRP
jgi:hypothetical protein